MRQKCRECEYCDCLIPVNIMPTFWKPYGVNKEGAAYGEDVAYNKAVTEGFGTAIQADAAEGEYKEFGQPDDENA